MNCNKKIGFIGAGNMASAIIDGIISKNFADSSDIYVFDIIEQKLEEYKSRGINTVLHIKDLIISSDIIFLAVKPQNISEVLNEISLLNIGINNKIFVSIAAGISIDYIKSIIGTDKKVIRVMPNIPLLLGYGASALSYAEPVSLSEFETVLGVFKTSGIAEVLDESQMNSIISLNGSSPAFVYMFAKALIGGGVMQGIDEDIAASLVFQTILGSAYMLINSGETPQQLIDRVSSPGGTTIAALNSFKSNNFNKIIENAMLACTKRADELGK